jgi:NAD(P)-dependent dehydrogenase (short-subunit alcohol dehydrogenase family)
MAGTLDTFGRVDGCFANAGIGGGGRHAFIDRTEEQWRSMFATNLDGVFHVFQVAARHMTERANAGDKFGRLVATSSLASLFGTARNEHYAATKAAINALCRALAVELARHGVTSDSEAPLRRAKRFRRHRGVSDEQGVVVSHRGLLCDRRGIYSVLISSRHPEVRALASLEGWQRVVAYPSRRAPKRARSSG